MKGFELSRDYEMLWTLAQDGYRIPAWVDYNRSNVIRDNPLRDIVEVKKAYMSDGVSVGTRGVGYDTGNGDLEQFTQRCQIHNLEFIKPIS